MSKTNMKILISLLMITLMIFSIFASVFASEVDIAVVDISVPVNSVELVPGEQSDIVINYIVTGKQEGTGTFKVYTYWLLDDGVFTGAEPVTITVGPRAAQDPATKGSIEGILEVSDSQSQGEFSLVVAPLDITNSNSTGAKLSEGDTDSLAVTIEESEDIIAPEIIVPADITVEATGPSGAAVDFDVTAIDNVDGIVNVDCDWPSGSIFPLGRTTVHCSATDNAGNTATASFDITVADTTAPIISGVPGNITAEATGPNGAAVTFDMPTASDLVDGNVTVFSDYESGAVFQLGTTTVHFTATDNAGNTATASFDITVADTTGPELTLPENITVYATDANGAVVNFTATAYDLVSGAVNVTCDPVSGSTFQIGTTTVSCTATDEAGNTTDGSFTVTVLYNFKGFFQPVDNPGPDDKIINTVKAGSAVPIKFSLDGYMGMDIFMAGYPKALDAELDPHASYEAIEAVAVTAGNSALSYDPLTQQYTYVWKTNKTWSTTTGKQLVIRFKDGTVRYALFNFSK